MAEDRSFAGIMRDAQGLFLDELSDSLDIETEHEVLQSLSELMLSKTTICPRVALQQYVWLIALLFQTLEALWKKVLHEHETKGKRESSSRILFRRVLF